MNSKIPLSLLLKYNVPNLFSFYSNTRKEGIEIGNIELFTEDQIEIVRRNIDKIVEIYRDHQFFWSNAGGWAPDEAYKILTRARLDWLHALSESLFTWTDIYRTSTDNEGKLILAWTNLGAILEGGIKLFLSVHILHYSKSPYRYRDKNRNLVEPDVLSLEKLKVFILKEDLFDKKWIKFITLVQDRRNSIHAYKHRNIGTWLEFYESIGKLHMFTLEIKKKLPYPY